MGISDELPFSADTFSGKVRLFPLPNLVLFPHVVLPLHIFEPRYVRMLEESLADDRLIAMALLAPGWEDKYEERPPVAPVACLGRVLSAQSAPENRYNVLLLGLQRVRLLRELPPTKPFREAEVELLTDQYPAASAATRAKLQATLMHALQEALSSVSGPTEQLAKVLASDHALGMLTDLLAYRLDLGPDLKEKLLGECNVDRRAALLTNFLKNAPHSAAHQGFPPQFSRN